MSNKIAFAAPVGEPVDLDQLVGIAEAMEKEDHIRKGRILVSKVVSAPRRAWNFLVNKTKTVYHTLRYGVEVAKAKLQSPQVRRDFKEGAWVAIKFVGSAIAFAAWMFVVYFIFIWALIAAINLFGIE